jgi:hypothetical protein
MTFRDSLVVRAAALWTVFVWGVFIRNLLGDPKQSAGFKAVHLAIGLVSVVFALAIWAVASRSRRPTARAERSDGGREH